MGIIFSGTQQDTDKKILVESLSLDLWNEILSFLSAKQILKIRTSCSILFRVTDDENLWSCIATKQFPKTKQLKTEQESWRKFVIKQCIPLSLKLEIPEESIILFRKAVSSSSSSRQVLGYSLVLKNNNRGTDYVLPYTKFSRSRRNFMSKWKVWIFNNPPTIAGKQVTSCAVSKAVAKQLHVQSIAYAQLKGEKFTKQKKAGDCHYQMKTNKNGQSCHGEISSSEMIVYLSQSRERVSLHSLFTQHNGVLYFQVAEAVPKVSTEKLQAAKYKQEPMREYEDDEDEPSRGLLSPFPGGAIISNIVRVKL